jgi:hypothetical protein
VPSALFPLCPTVAQTSIVLSATRTHFSPPLPSSGPMSHSHSIAASPPNFQPIINNALKAYKKRTKKDIRVHPLASQLEACSSPAAILAVLHQQVEGLDQSPNSDDRWTKWLGPTVNVLLTLSDTLGEGVGLVSLPGMNLSEICTHINGRYSHQRKQYLWELGYLSQCASFLISPSGIH